MMLTKEQLHAALVESGGVNEEQFEMAASASEAAQLGIDGVLVDHGILTDQQAGQLIALWYGVPFLHLHTTAISDDVLHMIPEAFARQQQIVPVKRDAAAVRVATSDPKNVVLKSLLEKYVREPVEFVYATPRDLNNSLFLFRKDPKTAFDAILKTAGETPGAGDAIIHLVNAFFDYAYQHGASDIHIEPEEEYVLVRFRVDGVLHDVTRLPLQVQEPVLTRLKVLARLATDEHRAAQDGKIAYKNTWGEEMEIRLSILPITHGEKAVMRLLSDKSRQRSLSDLGMHPDDLKHFRDVIGRPWGMLLVTGPTGSGKSTSLYSALKVLNRRDVNITTIEDPVEYDLENVNQTQVNEKTKLTFAKGLRSIVRQDPDIIMVGEIRDEETANIAVNAAMTGHLLLSTLHTNDAATAFPRLSDMGVEDFLVASTVNAIMAQRLVRQICRRCIQSYEPSKTDLQLIKRIPVVETYLKEIAEKEDLAQVRLFKGSGCQVCHQTGYVGRIGIFELLLVSEPVRQAVMAKHNADQIRDLAVGEGMTTMLYDGLRKVVLGQTTVEEVLRVTRD